MPITSSWCRSRWSRGLFKFDDEAMPADLRAQRVLNKARVPAIASYIANNASEYILSSLCASIDGEIAFEPAASEGPMRKVGQLRNRHGSDDTD